MGWGLKGYMRLRGGVELLVAPNNRAQLRACPIKRYTLQFHVRCRSDLGLGSRAERRGLIVDLMHSR